MFNINNNNDNIISLMQFFVLAIVVRIWLGEQCEEVKLKKTHLKWDLVYW